MKDEEVTSLTRILKDERGIALVMTLFALVLISIFSITIIALATSNYKMTKVDSKNQATYYIAEAGVNYIIDQINREIQEKANTYKSSVEFFKHIEDMFTKGTIALEDFKVNNGDQPKAFVTVSNVGTGEDTRDYRIESVGIIGDSRRTVEAIISISWFKEAGGWPPDLLFSTNKFIFNGSDFNAPGKTMVISGHGSSSLNGNAKLNVKNIYFKQLSNGIRSGRTYGDQNDPGDIFLDGDAGTLDGGRIIYGNVHTNGNFKMAGGATIYGNLYVDGKFEVAGGVNIYGDVHVNGDLIIKGGAVIEGDVYVHGNGDIDADGGGRIKGSLYLEGSLVIKGGATVEGEANVAGNIDATGGSKIKGKLRVGGDAKFKSVILDDNAYVHGNLELDWTPSLNKEVYYIGILRAPNNFSENILKKCISVDSLPEIPKVQAHEFSFELPDCSVSLKSDSWYEQNGYELKKGNITSDITNNARWVVDDYYNSSQKIYNEVVIISKGDIILRNVNKFRGALIAPKGVVEFNGGEFQGVIISNNEINFSRWCTADVETLEEYFNGLNIPVNFNCSNNDGSGGQDESNIDVQLIIKAGIREK